MSLLMNIDKFLMALNKVKKTGHNKWLACCPVHADQSPSLAIRLVEGERLLFHCFGCGANGIEICKALGINPQELFPPTDKNYKRERVPFPAEQILAALVSEAGIVTAASNAIVNGEKLSTIDVERVETARNRLTEALNYAKT